MKYIKHKVFWVWQAEKEEQWLNQMSQNGFALISVNFFTYHFEDSKPGEYIFRMELQKDWPTTIEGQSHIRFVEETGAEYIGSLSRWLYFRKKAEEGAFNLFSDLDSRIRQIHQILWILFPLLLINGFNLINLLFINSRFFFLDAVVTAVVTFLVALLLFSLILLIYALAVCLWRLRKLNKEKKIRE